jgi:hypothetical protein
MYHLCVFFGTFCFMYLGEEISFGEMFSLSTLVGVHVALAWNNGVAKTPPRGFSTWNAFPVHSIDEATCYSYMNSIVAAVRISQFSFGVFVFWQQPRRVLT